MKNYVVREKGRRLGVERATSNRKAREELSVKREHKRKHDPSKHNGLWNHMLKPPKKGEGFGEMDWDW